MSSMANTSFDMRSHDRWVTSWILVLLVMVVGGCGPSANTGRVSGSVKHQDAEVEPGTKIYLEDPAKGYIAGGVVQSDGTYELKYQGSDDIPVGDYVIFIGPPDSNMSEAEFMALSRKVAKEYRARGKKPPPSPDWTLPQEYYQASTTPLKHSVVEGKNIVDVVMD